MVVESTLRELLISSCEPPTGLDPAELMQDIDWLESRSGLCLSFDEHLAALGRYDAQHNAGVSALGERGQVQRLLLGRKKCEAHLYATN